VVWVAVVPGVAVLSTWLFAAEADGALPFGNFEPTPHRSWPVAPEHADAIRRDALVRAGLRLPTDSRPLARSGESRDTALLTCRYLADVPSGTSAKFTCILDGGEVIKVKYGRNPEIHAEAAATRLLTRLGYAADEVQIVPRVRCYGCPRFPFFTNRLLTLVRASALIPAHGYDSAFTDFEWVAVERRFPAAHIETPAIEGWAWFELTASQAPRAELDAFRLLAAFLAHWDNKAENQRLVCLDPLPEHTGVPCARPLLMIQDLGATFGPVKVNVAGWETLPVWSDRTTCRVSMRALPFAGATFVDAQISETGRAQLADALSRLSREEIEDLFRTARFPEFHSGTDDERDLDAWGDAFEHRVAQITSNVCPS
jgi:hypothetical protein